MLIIKEPLNLTYTEDEGIMYPQIKISEDSPIIYELAGEGQKEFWRMVV